MFECQRLRQVCRFRAVCVCVCVCAYVRSMATCAGLNCLNIHDYVCVGVCVCVCVSISISVSVSDRCVGSGRRFGRPGPGPRAPSRPLPRRRRRPARAGRLARLRSRSAGRAPGRGHPSCGGACTPGPRSARACRCATRSGGRSRSPRSSRTTSGTCLPPDLGAEREREGGERREREREGRLGYL